MDVASLNETDLKLLYKCLSDARGGLVSRVLDDSPFLALKAMETIYCMYTIASTKSLLHVELHLPAQLLARLCLLVQLQEVMCTRMLNIHRSSLIIL